MARGVMCPAEVSPNCPGHTVTEKYRDCLTAALIECPDDTTGNVDGFGLWVGLVIQAEAIELPSGAGVPVFIPADTYRLISEDNDGHVVSVEFQTAEGAQRAFDDWQDDYSAYLHAVDMREHAITSSTGRVGR